MGAEEGCWEYEEQVSKLYREIEDKNKQIQQLQEELEALREIILTTEDDRIQRGK